MFGLLLSVSLSQGETATAQSKTQATAISNKQAVRAKKHFDAGHKAYSAGKFELARKELKAADALLPSPALAFDLAVVSERAGRASDAVRYYERYLASDDPTKTERRLLVRKKEELAVLAQRQQEQLKLPSPSNDELTAEARKFFERGLSLYKRKELKGALAAFMAVYQLRQTPELLYNLAAVSEALGRKRDAIDYFEAYLRKLPTAADAKSVRKHIASLK